jgi:hypothetical protein
MTGRAPGADRVAGRLEARIVGPEIEAPQDGPHRPLALPQGEVDPRLVEEEIGVGPRLAERLLAEDHAEVRVPLDEDERHAVPGHEARIARGAPVRALERLVRGAEVAGGEGRPPRLEGGRRGLRGVLERNGTHRFRSCRIRRPSRVRCSSTSWMVFETPAMRGARPPVATILGVKPSSSDIREQTPSTSPT